MSQNVKSLNYCRPTLAWTTGGVALRWREHAGSRWMPRLLVGIVVVQVMVAYRSGVASDQSGNDGPAICLEHAMPVIGQPCQLWIRSAGGDPKDQRQRASVTFLITTDGEKTERIALSPNPAGGAASGKVTWVPRKTGPSKVSAVVNLIRR